jgi:hypothetical protein
LRTYKLAAAALVAPLLALVAPTSSTAVTTVSVEAADVTVKYDACKRTTVTATGDWNVDPSNEIEVTIRNPHGGVFDSRTFFDNADGFVSMRVQLCNGNSQGTYSVEVVATGYDELGEVTSTAEATTSFKYKHVPKARSRIRYKVDYQASRPTYKYVVPGQLLRAGRGFARTRVVLAARIEGTWYVIDKMRTRKRGVFGWQFKPNGVRWRYYYLGNRSTKPVRTATFRTPRRVSARATVPTVASREQLKDLVVRRD